MSKNIIIQEGGTGRQFTADKLKTALAGGSSCLWIPEDEAKLGTKSITEDGTYEAADDGLYGYSEVTVRGIGKVTGKDPTTGEETQVTTETDPETGEQTIKTKTIPSSIRIVTPPARLEYNDGDLIDFSGMVVKAFLKSGALFEDESYPYGIIPDSELDKPVKVAKAGPNQFRARADSLIDDAGIISENDGTRTPVYKVNDGWCACFLGDNVCGTDYGGNWLVTFCVGMSYNDVKMQAAGAHTGTMTIDGIQYYYAWAGTNPGYGGARKFTSNPHGLPVIKDELLIGVNSSPTYSQFKRWLEILEFVTGGGDLLIDNLSEWYGQSMNGMTIQYANGVNTISGKTISGWEHVYKQIEVIPNRDYVFRIKMAAPSFIEDIRHVHRDYIAVMATAPSGSTWIDNQNQNVIAKTYYGSGFKGEITVPFNSGDRHYVCLVIGFDAIEDNQQLVFTISDISVDGWGSTRNAASIPVNWQSPYDGKTMTDHFAITVKPAPEPETEGGNAP